MHTVPTQYVDEAAADAVDAFRATLRAWPRHAAARLAALGSDEAAIEAQLSADVETMLDDLARRFEAMAEAERRLQ